MKPDISRKQRTFLFLEKIGRASTIDDISQAIGVPVDKVRQTLTTFDTDVVRVGHKLFDLSHRVHKGRVFRYTPTASEYEAGVLRADEDLLYFFTAYRNYGADITLQDIDGSTYMLHRVMVNKHAPFDHFSGAEKLFIQLQMKEGDDLLFTCQDLSTHTYLVRREASEDRDKLQITMRNEQLADMVADILLHSPSHYEADLFLIRKYLFIYPYFSDPAPDSLRRAIANDPRFIITPRDRLFSWTGNLISGERLIVGLKKYYLRLPEGDYIPVIIQTDDEFGGKLAYCTHCDEHLIWEKNTGWRHMYNEMEWVDAYIPKEFFLYSDKQKKTH